jgi:hypothetical protein
MGDLSDSKGGQIVGARLAGARVTKTATLSGLSRATISEVMSAYTNHGKITLAKRVTGRKSISTEKDRRALRRIVSKNHTITCSTGNRTAELNIHFEHLISTKTV